MEEKKETKLHVIEQNGKFGYADENGNVVIPCVWDASHEFSEGRAAVLKRHAGWGYIDMQGELVIKCGYVSACDFKDGIACVKQDSDFDLEFFGKSEPFYIDKDGEVMPDKEFEDEFVTRSLLQAESYEKGIGLEKDLLEAFKQYDFLVEMKKDERAIQKVKEILEENPHLRELPEVSCSYSVMFEERYRRDG